jgi:hypothetical protein
MGSRREAALTAKAPPLRWQSCFPLGRGFVLAAVFSLLSLASASTAEAYVRTRSKSGVPVAWRLPQVLLKVVAPSEAFTTTPETFASTVIRSAATWSHDAIPCTGIQLNVDSQHLSSGVVRNDGVNTVMVTEQGWSHMLAAIALTTVFLRNSPQGPEDGEILDADIEINGADYSWADIPDDVTSLRDYLNDEDLRNALTHELGHLLGLWHNCHGDTEAPLPDDQGHPSPDCGNATLAMHGATMFPSTEFAAVDKRVLSSDELSAACAIYPYTFRLEGAGCAIAPQGHAPPPVAHAERPEASVLSEPSGFLVVVGAFALCRRRRASRSL